MVFARSVRIAFCLVVSCALVAPTASAVPVGSAPPPRSPSKPPPKLATAVGHGGAVSSVDPYATRIGIRTLRRGGTATDAAVAVAAALGVTEPYSSGIGGGGYFVHHDADTGEVSTIDGRETAPAAASEDLFVENGEPLSFDEAVTSGLSVGVPGTAATWQRALREWGEMDLGRVLRPAQRLAGKGFVVDETFRAQTARNEERFRDFPASRKLFLPGGELPEVGSVFRNPALAETYGLLARKGPAPFYEGEIGADIAETVREPGVAPGADRVVRPGGMTRADLANYRTIERAPTHVEYRDADVYGMAPSSSGGTTVGEALNILERTDLSEADKAEYLHRFLEATKLSFADRNRWVGDPAFSDVPTEELLGQRFADSRECLIEPDSVLEAPVAAGDPRDPHRCRPRTSKAELPYEGPSTTHLTVADAAGNVVSYTLTIEQTGGSGMTVPGRGFLLNNELTDFSFTPNTPGVPDPNLPGPGKRPRSSMSPTIVLSDGEPLLALGTPGGTTIITSVVQVLTGRLDRGMSLPEAITTPRASQRNTERTAAEPGFLRQRVTGKLRETGHSFEQMAEIGAVTGVERLPGGRWVAAAEPERRGGGAASVVRPSP
ncbi:gamma-glutamyltranspeptidase/glutathione hydrolase [Saccharopolyspora lacisalsi]|uniref:Glutathione hydrolase proenzyme n=1 Tax=Halosaccharopolyspora lacisalsi TaxID=1000566 RepID=A0A839DTE1_9PSEU|nr:gamma-glutamyltransferase [Halosaccharopolyspora lacisalsi]MBA8823546.1 gamma-glutamyltranspeptidase/glutathione hydrolase [Halosaccharopolyspora lacisalsi]